uniref:Putative secreted protein n=1 Tax=Anopheles darlingi TaxID=43151 RepID=A0A2M4DIU6_ANODA
MSGIPHTAPYTGDLTISLFVLALLVRNTRSFLEMYDKNGSFASPCHRYTTAGFRFRNISNAPRAPNVDEHCVSRWSISMRKPASSPPGSVTTFVAISITGSTVDRIRTSRALLGFSGNRMANLINFPCPSVSIDVPS